MAGSGWTHLKESELLEKRISDLGLQIAGTWVAPLIQKLYEELDQKGLTFRPPVFLADEWFVPDGIPAIGIPFYLAHERLKQLERKMMLEAEGGNRIEFMRLLRHEAGHAYTHAYLLHKRKKWIRLFGPSSKEYPEPDSYKVRPYSRSFVIHLDNLYAQAHPDEDFAETFAVWLTPGLNWRKRYRGWKALEKLEYVDELMRQIAGKPPLYRPCIHPDEYSGLGIKLKTFYRRKRKLYEDDFPDFYDSDLRLLFTDEAAQGSAVRASRYLKENRDRILNAVALWTKEKKYTTAQLLDRLRCRCDELGLYTRAGAADLDFQVSAYIASLVMNYIYTGKLKRPK